MPDINTMKNSRFLRKEDCGAGLLLTIKTCEQMNVGMDDADEDIKWCLTFEEHPKPYVTNATNRAIIAQFSGRPNTDEWPGLKIVLFNNPNVGYGGKMTGGISARAPRTPAQPKAIPPAAAASQKPAAPEAEEEPRDDNVPF